MTNWIPKYNTIYNNRQRMEVCGRAEVVEIEVKWEVVPAAMVIATKKKKVVN